MRLRHVIASASSILAVFGLIAWRGGCLRNGASNLGPQVQPESPAASVDPSRGARFGVEIDAQPSRVRVPARHVLVRVVDEDGAGIVGACVAARASPAGHPEEVRTNAAGQVGLDVASDAAVLSLLVSADAFVPATGNIDGQSSSVTIRLARVPAIRGIVTTTSGEDVRSGIHVLAVEADRPAPGSREVRAILAEGRSPLLAVSDSDGHFAIRGAEVDKRYDLYAGGRGVISVAPQRRVSIGMQGVAIEVEPAFAAAIALLDQTGKPVTMSSALSGGPAYTLWTEDPRASMPQFPMIPFVLAGGDPDLFDADPSRVLHIVTSAAGGDVSTPGCMSVSLPGYAQVVHRFTDVRVGGKIEPETCYLKCGATGWGQLSLGLCQSDADVLGMLGVDSLSGVVRLVSGEGIVSYPVTLSTGGTAVIDEVPFGQYELSFVGRTLFRWPPPGTRAPEIRVGRDPVVVQMSLGDVGVISLEFVDKGGSAHCGPVSIAIGRGEPIVTARGTTRLEDSATLSSKGPRVLVGPLDAGRYSVIVQQPHCVMPASGPVIQFDVKASELSHYVLSVVP